MKTLREREMKRIVLRNIEPGDVIEVYGVTVRILDFYRYGALVELENGARSFFLWADLMNAR